ncbi:MAG: alternative ribosome rescue aminoacyl-tRNA hydrolase ArfB, partial [Gemmatimonadales bacterium]
NDAVVIPQSELEVRASRSGGPGGQHVNTSSTRIEVVWNVRTSGALDEAARARLVAGLASRLDADGGLRVVASDTRSQRQNRELAEQRLAEVVRKALVVQKPRKRTRPHRGAVEQRLAEKKRRSSQKRERRSRDDE